MPNSDMTAQGTATPPFTGAAPGPVPATDPSAQLDQQLQQLMSRTMAQRTHIPVPQQQPAQKTPMMQGPATTHAEGNQLFFHNLGALIGNAAQQAKQSQIKQATGVLQQLSNAHDKYQEMVIAQGVSDPAEIQKRTIQLMGQAPEVQEILADKKKMKQLQKLGQLDLFNPDAKQDVVHEAAKRVGKANKIQQTMRAMGQVMQAHRQQQLRPPEQLLQQIEGRSQMQPTDTKGAVDVAKTEAELTTARANMLKAQQDIKNKYDFKVDQSGQWLALDKQTGKGAVITDDKGKPLTGQVKAGAGEGKVAMVENVPYGITHTGLDGRPKIITPGDPEWTPADAKVLAAATSAQAAGEANKAKLAEKRQNFYSALPYNGLAKVMMPAGTLGPQQTRPIAAGELVPTTRAFATAHPDMVAPVSSGDKALGTQARFGEIQATVDMTNNAIANLPDTAFDPKARAQVAYVLRAPDPASALDAFFKSDVAATLTDAQVDYVTSLVSMAESAQAMSSLQGIGARGSDTLRASIVAMLPSGSTPSRKYAEAQMKKFQVELDQLRKGVPTLGGLSGDTSEPKGTISFTDAGVTYDIPKDKVGAFKKAHPNAATAR